MLWPDVITYQSSFQKTALALSQHVESVGIDETKTPIWLSATLTFLFQATGHPDIGASLCAEPFVNGVVPAWSRKLNSIMAYDSYCAMHTI